MLLPSYLFIMLVSFQRPFSMQHGKNLLLYMLFFLTRTLGTPSVASVSSSVFLLHFLSMLVLSVQNNSYMLILHLILICKRTRFFFLKKIFLQPLLLFGKLRACLGNPAGLAWISVGSWITVYLNKVHINSISLQPKSCGRKIRPL